MKHAKEYLKQPNIHSGPGTADQARGAVLREVVHVAAVLRVRHGEQQQVRGHGLLLPDEHLIKHGERVDLKHLLHTPKGALTTLKGTWTATIGQPKL